MIPPEVNIDGKARFITLTFGPMKNGGSYWCYVAVKPSRFNEFMALTQAKNYNIHNFVDDGFGEVIVSGQGAMPPTDVTKQVAKIFNVPIKELFTEIDTQAFINGHLPRVSRDDTHA